MKMEYNNALQEVRFARLTQIKNKLIFTISNTITLTDPDGYAVFLEEDGTYMFIPNSATLREKLD